jgi:succinate-semialdehyde dehydrogenase / glutarate-semialdehyde dehydrogenase
MGIATINPATGATLKEFAALTGAEIDSKLALAQQRFETYRYTTFEQRATWLHRASEILIEQKERLGAVMTQEMGKPLAAAVAEVEKSAWVCRYYADHAAQFLADQPVETDASHSFICYQPLGIILAVMPWNFPFWQVFRFAAPALMAGNVGLLKHASNVPQSALEIEAVLTQAGFPAGAFQTLLIGAEQVTQVINDDRVKAAALTGSEPAGASLASAAGKQIKKTVLELGGSDPFIVLESADLDAAVATAVTARMINNGQSCIAAKRFIIQDTIADAFNERLVQRYAALKLGDPMHPDTDVGPLATPTILKELDAQVRAGVASGGKLLIGGDLDAITLSSELQQGNFYPPTILADLPPDSPTRQEEFFGPVALLFRVPNLESAIQLANETSFGLGASAWSQEPAEIERLARDLEAGSVFINGMVKSDPRLPFGGIKRSGYGRELGAEGIREFVNIKTVWMK